MRKRLGNRGMTILELVVTLAILSLVGTMVLSLVSAGRSSSNRIQADIADATEARTAMSLVTVALRQHDEIGAINLYNTDFNNIRLTMKDNPSAPSEEERKKGTVLLFKKSDMDGLCYIYAIDRTGEYQNVDDAVQPAELEAVVPLAVVKSVEITRNIVNNAWVYTIAMTYGEDGQEKRLEQSIKLRSAIGAET